MRLLDVKCKACGTEQEILVRTGEAPAPEEGCACGNKDADGFEVVYCPAKAPTHSSWKVK